MGEILTTNDTLKCPHGASIVLSAPSSKAKADRGLVLRPDDGFTVVLCPFTIGPTHHPCKTVKWQMPSVRTKVGGSPVLTTDSIGLCLAADQAPQGMALIVKTQRKVRSR